MELLGPKHKGLGWEMPTGLYGLVPETSPDFIGLHQLSLGKKA